MAKIAPKGKKVKGTKKNDKITWTSSAPWKKALTVNAGKGNDVINFKKSKYKNTLNGQDGNDIIYGGSNIDNINGGAGDDKLYGYNGNDIIKAGAGNDFVDGGNGNDQLYGESGTNTINGGAGNDSIYGGTGNEKLFGNNGNDIIKTGAGNNYADGGAGDDKIYGESGNNILKGGAGNDSINGGTGNDNIEGGAGNDLINAGKGNNQINISKNAGRDTIISGGGNDTITFWDESYFIAPGGVVGTSLNAQWSGNDLIITGTEGNSSVVLKDYANGNHSAQWISTRNNSFRTDSLVPKNEITEAILGDNRTINGTSKADKIKINFGDDEHNTTNNYAAYLTVNAYSGDDIIELYNTPEFYIRPGAGNDTIKLSGENKCQSGIIELQKNGGSDELYGIDNSNWRYNIILNASTGTTNEDFDNSLLVRKSGSIEYILGEQKGNDLIIKLTDGNTFTVHDYYARDNYGNWNYDKLAFVTGIGDDYLPSTNGVSYERSTLSSYLYTESPFGVTLNKKNTTVNKPDFNGLCSINASEDGNYTVNIGNGYRNGVMIDKNGNHNITTGNGNENYVKIGLNIGLAYMDGMEPVPVDVMAGDAPVVKPADSVNGNQTVKVGNGHGNRVEVSTNGTSNVTVGNGNGNFIKVSNATESTIITGNGQGNNINSFGTVSNTITTGTGQNIIYLGYNNGINHSDDIINSYGYDVIQDIKANTEINLYGTQKKVMLGEYGLTSDPSNKVSTTITNFGSGTNNVYVGIYRTASMPYWSYGGDDDGDGKYDLVFSMLNMGYSNEVSNNELILKNVYLGGENYESWFDQSSLSCTKVCDMGKAGINTFNCDVPGVFENSAAVINSAGNDTITVNNGTHVLLTSGTNTLNTSSQGLISVSGGTNTINLIAPQADDFKTREIRIKGDTQTTINNVENFEFNVTEPNNPVQQAVPLNIKFSTKSLDNNEIMVYHDYDWNAELPNPDGLHLVTRHFDADVEITDIYKDYEAGDDYHNEFKAGVLSNFIVSDKNDKTENIENLWNYYDMNHFNTHTYNESLTSRYSSGKFLIDGTEGDDNYYNIRISGPNEKRDIYDYGGDNDQICFENDLFFEHSLNDTDYDQGLGGSVFFNVEIERNADFTLKRSTFGDDLYFSADMWSLFDTDSSNDAYTCIHNYFDVDREGIGYIESITDMDGNEIDFAGLTELRNEIAGWIAENTPYSSVSDVIANGTPDQKEMLMAKFIDADPWTYNF